jgi:hypothetical protein
LGEEEERERAREEKGFEEGELGIQVVGAKLKP